MDRRARLALTAAGLCASAAAARAQNPPATPPAHADTAQRDSLAPQLLYDETVGAGIVPRVVLQAGVVYRIETRPGVSVDVRYSQRPLAPPLLLVPLEGGGPEPSGAASFLVVPRTTGEYRFDLAEAAVTLRIWTDPKEMSRWARMRAATAGTPAAGLSLRMVSLGPFVRPFGPPNTTPSTPPGIAGAVGTEACFALTPRGSWMHGAVGGCVVFVGRYWRPSPAGGMLLIGTEPELELTGPASRLKGGVSFELGIGTSVAVPNEMSGMDYLLLGLGLDAAYPALGRHVFVDVEAGLARLQQLEGFLDGVGKASVVPRLAAGLEVRF